MKCCQFKCAFFFYFGEIQVKVKLQKDGRLFRRTSFKIYILIQRYFFFQVHDTDTDHALTQTDNMPSDTFLFMKHYG